MSCSERLLQLSMSKESSVIFVVTLALIRYTSSYWCEPDPKMVELTKHLSDRSPERQVT